MANIGTLYLHILYKRLTCSQIKILNLAFDIMKTFSYTRIIHIYELVMLQEQNLIPVFIEPSTLVPPFLP